VAIDRLENALLIVVELLWPQRLFLKYFLLGCVDRKFLLDCGFATAGLGPCNCGPVCLVGHRVDDFAYLSI